MVFTSMQFFIFLPIVFFVYYIYPKKKQWVLLLLSSYVFYAFAGIQYVFLLVYTTITAYVFSKLICRRKSQMVLGIVFLLIPLVWFKYTNFLIDNINIIVNAFGSAKALSSMQIILPLGISFYSFSALGYVIDIYNNKYAPYDNPFHLAAGLSFFPCLLAGPIERQNKLIPQLIMEHEFDYTKATYGLKQIAWGLFEKTVVADNLAIYVDKVFDDVYSYHGITLLAASFFYSIQIYCDFAGYSDIAIGIAKLFGIEVTKNFDSPYFSSSLKEFWKRWHISLSSWIRDYVYIPLGGSRNGRIRKHANLVIAMFISGIWHGAAWTFIAWGGMHGLLQVLEDRVSQRKTESRLLNAVKIIITFIMCSCLWVFFRAPSFENAIYIFQHMFDGYTQFNNYFQGINTIGLSSIEIMILIIELSILFVHDYYSIKTDVIELISEKPFLLRWSIYVIHSVLLVLLSYKGATKFVYFDF